MFSRKYVEKMIAKLRGGDEKDPDKGDNMNDNKGNKLLYCSFCGKSQHEVEKLIAGPSVFICSECVGLCNEIIREEPEDVEAEDTREESSEFESITNRTGITNEVTMKDNKSDNASVHKESKQGYGLSKYLKVAVRSGLINAAICFEKDVRDSFFGWIENERREN